MHMDESSRQGYQDGSAEVQERYVLESQLIEHTQAGDQAALGQLIALHYGAVFGTALRHLGGANWHEAEDVTQETMIRLMGGIGTFEDRGKGVRGFLGTVLGNVIKDRYRKRLTRPIESSIDDNLDIISQLADPRSVTAFDEISVNDEVDVLLTAIPGPKMREVVAAVDVLGLDNQDYIAITGLAKGTVGTRLMRGRAHVRRALASRGITSHQGYWDANGFEPTDMVV